MKNRLVVVGRTEGEARRPFARGQVRAGEVGEGKWGQGRAVEGRWGQVRAWWLCDRGAGKWGE